MLVVVVLSCPFRSLLWWINFVAALCWWPLPVVQAYMSESWAMLSRMPSPTCVDIPRNFSLCHGIDYRRMRLPNLVEHETLDEAVQQAAPWISLLRLNCHADTQRFLCSLFAPVCLERAIYPCRSLCEAVKSGCEKRMEMYGFPWPEMLNCNKFPVTNDMCIQARETYQGMVVFLSCSTLPYTVRPRLRRVGEIGRRCIIFPVESGGPLTLINDDPFSHVATVDPCRDSGACLAHWELVGAGSFGCVKRPVLSTAVGWHKTRPRRSFTTAVPPLSGATLLSLSPESDGKHLQLNGAAAEDQLSDDASASAEG
ncbi:unnamed protein product [Soboliphyme baturini]|uniref:FZ domain-containing protein n=1 Tax=Soboliphyme baturini TaxID=241478 RepID=A0A183IXK7_9BILA|nr:unnamed protein product [Soboliphyme baturini]